MSKLTIREQMDLNNLRLAFREGLVTAEHQEKASTRYAELISKSMNGTKPLSPVRITVHKSEVIAS